MSTEEEAKYTCRLEDAIAEYEKAKAMYDEWWSEEKLEYLKDAEAFISGEELPIRKVGCYATDDNEVLAEIFFYIGKAIRAYEKRKKYWHDVVEEKTSEIACIVPRGQVVELDGETIEGIGEAV